MAMEVYPFSDESTEKASNDIFKFYPDVNIYIKYAGRSHVTNEVHVGSVHHFFSSLSLRRFIFLVCVYVCKVYLPLVL